MTDEFAAWFEGKALSTDWTSRFFAPWAALFAARRDEPLDILEIGSWEGRSAVFFLNCFAHARLTCVDTFGGSPEHGLREKWSRALPQIEARFEANVAEFGDRVRTIKDTSERALTRLAVEGARFDLVYVDGSHHSADVLSDATLVWPMVRERGIVIFDDYEWDFFPDPVRTPKAGVDAFLDGRHGEYRELQRGYQVIVEKTTLS